jgi:hypothetical protein
MIRLAHASLVPASLLLLTLGCSNGSSPTSSPGSASAGLPSPAVPTEGPSMDTSTGDTGTGAVVGATGTTGSGGATGTTGVGAAAPSSATGAADTTSGAPSATGAAGAAGTVTTMPPVEQASLTAGKWDDNLNFDFYQQYLATIDATQLAGLPLIDRTGRLKITAVDGAGAPLAGARVTVSDASGKLFEAPTRGDGKIFFFPGTVGAQTGDALQVAAVVAQSQATVAAHVGDAKADVAVTSATATPPTTLDLALVVDTTGSMGDELAYLQTEISDIITRVATDYPNVAQRWSAVFYRDTDVGDEYVVRAFDFTTSLATLTSEIAVQSAAGGGDYPESPDLALAKLTTLSWLPGSVARMAFWVADAPHHAERAPTMVQDVLAAHGIGIRLYPIAASGTDDLLEYTMRTTAEVTGGRYLFLTNDSGIGGSHKEPTIPCYVVTTLAKAMRRMIDMELTGTDSPPAAADIIRTSGDPTNGTCALDGGQIVTVL